MNFKKLFSLLMISFSITVLSCDNSFNDIYDMFGQKPFIFVTPTGAGTMDGSSWENARQLNQATIDAAQPGQEIWVAKGDYNLGGTGLTINKDISIYGGFDTGDTSREKSYSVDNGTNIIASNEIIIMTGSSVNPDTIICGLSFKAPAETGIFLVNGASPTIRYCYFNGLNSPADYAGISGCSNSSLKIEKCLFKSCNALGSGSAIGAPSNCSVSIVSCIFENNTSGADGGAIFADSANMYISGGTVFKGNNGDMTSFGGAISITNGSLTITDGLFENNINAQYGGAIAATNSNVSLNNTTFIGNSAVNNGNGGALYFNDGGQAKNLSISNCTFGSIVTGETAKGNKSYTSTSGGSGGALYINATSTDSSINISSTNVGNNKSGSGGGIYLSARHATGKTVRIFGCTVSKNTASTNGAGIYLSHYSDATVYFYKFVNCIFSDNNTSGSGGAIYSDTNPMIIKLFNCLFTNNNTTASSTHGGAMSINNNGGLYVLSSTFAKNYTNGNSEAIYTTCSSSFYNSIVWNPVSGESVLNSSSTLNTTVRHSYFSHIDNSYIKSDGAATPPIPDDIVINTTDPFVMSSANNFHLSGVACVDKGDSKYTNVEGEKLTVDLGGSPRVNGGNTDCGAYEK